MIASCHKSIFHTLQESLENEVNDAMNVLMNSNELSTATESNQDDTHMEMGEDVNGGSNDNNVTHIEVCLEVFNKGLQEQGIATLELLYALVWLASNLQTCELQWGSHFMAVKRTFCDYL